MVKGLGVMYAAPVVREGVLRRGVVSAEFPPELTQAIDRDKWVILHCVHDANPPRIDSVTDLYQCDPFFDYVLGDRPRVHAIPRDFIDEDVYQPRWKEKDYDVLFNACWVEAKRPMLLVDALQHAYDAGRPISCLWYGYHFGDGPSEALEAAVRRRTAHLPVTFLPADFDRDENNRRYNSARIAVMTSKAEGGPRVMSEAMLANLPYLAAADVHGGSAAYLTPANRNGGLFNPTPEGIAECIWRTLDSLWEFEPREWAVANMCRTVAVARLKDALRGLEDNLGWHINWQDADHNGILITDWWKLVFAADSAV